MGFSTTNTSFSRDSAIYCYGSGISTNRILEGHKKNYAKQGEPKVKCLLINKQERWVVFLKNRKEHTRAKVFSDFKKTKMRAVKHTQRNMRERIAAIITAPNRSWAKQKKQEKYTIPHNYFGQYA